MGTRPQPESAAERAGRDHSTAIPPTTSELAIDLTRIDAVLRGALATIGVDWVGAPRSRTSRPGEYLLPGLRRAIAAFGLSAFDCDALLLALAPEVDERYAAAFAALHRNPAMTRPSIGLALRLLAESVGATAASAFTALAPSSRLIANQLVRLLGDGPYAMRTYALPIAVLCQLLEDRASPSAGIVKPIANLDHLVLSPRTRRGVERAVGEARVRRHEDVLVAVHGPYGRRAIADAIAAALDQHVVAVSPVLLQEPMRLPELLRDARWWGAAILIEPAAMIGDVLRVCSEATSRVIAIVEPDQLRELIAASPREVVEVALDELDVGDRAAVWSRFAPDLDEVSVGALAARYRFGPGRIAATATLARERAAVNGKRVSIAEIGEACRAAGSATNGLVHRVLGEHQAEDLIVTPGTRRELDLLESAARHGHRVFAPGGAGARLPGSGGIVALFAGPPGTGKTMAAQIIARRLELDLLRVDLSQVVNKYIGETEKHLDRVFREGEATGAILFFDEADSLFSKRTDVRDAHDRYANLETAFLLQRLEVHRGVVILATNVKQSLDPAFVRRIQIVADFALPAAPERQMIWERHLVADTLSPDVDLGFLSRFPLAGGDIRNAVGSAALLAAREGVPVAMIHLVLGVWRELSKAGRLADAGDFGAFGDAVLQYAKGTP